MPSLLQIDHGECSGDPRALSVAVALREIGARVEALRAECFVVFDASWTTHVSYHVNGDAVHVADWTFAGDPQLAALIVEEARAAALSVDVPSCGTRAPGVGTLVPLYHIDPAVRARVVPIAVPALANGASHRRFGEAVMRAIARSGRRVAILASGALSRPEGDGRGTGIDGSRDPWSVRAPQFNYRMDACAIDLWRRGRFDAFAEMLSEYARHADPVLAMGDLQMLFGVLGCGWPSREAEPLCGYHAVDGAGQAVVDFRV